MITMDQDPEKLAVFVQEYIRREHQADAGVVAVIAADLRHAQYLPHHIAEKLLSQPEIQAMMSIVRKLYKPPEIKEISSDTITADMEQVYQKALDDRQYTAAISAKKTQAELHGLLKQTVDINVRHTVATMTDDKLEEIARRGVIDGEFQEVSGLPSVVDA